MLHTSTCISDNGKVIGDGLYLATGAKITSKVTLGNGVSIGANSVVNKDSGDNVLLVGMPAEMKRSRKIWYEEENDIHYKRVKKDRDFDGLRTSSEKENIMLSVAQASKTIFINDSRNT